MTWFITGLPRSRTGWAANWLTSGDHLCLHDVVGTVDDISKLPAQLDGANLADPALLLVWPRIEDVFKNSNWIIIERPFTEVVLSCGNLPAMSEVPPGHREAFVYRLLESQHRLQEARECHMFDYYDLDAKRMWELVNGDGYSEARHRMLDGMRVESLGDLTKSDVTDANVRALLEAG